MKSLNILRIQNNILRIVYSSTLTKGGKLKVGKSNQKTRVYRNTFPLRSALSYILKGVPLRGAIPQILLEEVLSTAIAMLTALIVTEM